MKRVIVVCAIVIGASLTHAAMLSEGGCTPKQAATFSTCEHTALTQTITFNGVTMTIENAVANALDTGNTETGIVVGLLTIASELGMPLALDTIECAINMIDGAEPTTTVDAGVTTAVAGLTRKQRIAIGRAWLVKQRAAQAQSGK